MHYVPASFFTPLDDSSGGGSDAATAADQSPAPLYLLTAVVGLLLGADVLLEFIGDPEWLAYRTWFGFRLALLAAVIGGSRILFHTLEGLLEERIGADLALTIACLAAIVMGEPSVAAFVVFIAVCGESLEGFVAGTAQRAVGELIAMRPKIAHVMREGEEWDVPLEEVEVGDTVVIRPGERIPVDGYVLLGRSAVDQSALTGESWPVDKEEGSQVYTGTLNQFGGLTVHVEQVGSATTFGQIVAQMAQALARKTPLERTADRLARYFLPAVLGAAGLTLLAWRFQTGNWSAGWLPALAVLVVACPCPLILATPSAVLASLAWLARKGVVIKGSFALERLASVDTIAFDKTGTLTTGDLQIGSIEAWGLDQTELLRIVGGAERHSEHPLARLLVTEAESRGSVLPETVEFTAHPGAGVVALFRETALGPVLVHSPEDLSADRFKPVFVGNRRFLEAQNVPVSPVVEEALSSLDSAGQTPVLVAIDGEIRGLIGIRDTLRSEAADVLRELRDSGITTRVLLTGDRASTAEIVAQGVGGFDYVGAELFPLEKSAWVSEQIRAGKRVAMVGDGVNDAPALAEATVGLALGRVGSQIAAEAGDVVLMGDPLAPLPGLLRLSRELVRNIRQSIFLFAFGLNGIGVVLCATGVLSPVGAALFHEAASLAVMLNALRLLWFERWDETKLGQWSRDAGTLSDWMATRLSPHHLALIFLRRWGLIAQLSAVAAGFFWLLSNLVLINGDEVAVVTRFGRYETTLEPGLYLRWPRPFERVYPEKVDYVRTLRIGFRGDEVQEIPAGQYMSPIEWQAEHSAAEGTSLADEARVLSGGELPLELTATLRFRIDDLRQYLHGVTVGEDVLRAITEGAVRQVAARLALDDILTEHRHAIESECLGLIQSKVANYGLGIKPLALELLEIHPAAAVVPNYREVADAMEEREQLINEAQTTYAREMLSVAGLEALQLLNRTGDIVVDPSKEDEGANVSSPPLDDETWRTLIEKNGDGNRVLSGAAASQLLSAEERKSVQVRKATGESARFSAMQQAFGRHPSLTSQELYWSFVDGALSKASLTIIDPQAAGRKQFFLRNRPDSGPDFSPPLPIIQSPSDEADEDLGTSGE